MSATAFETGATIVLRDEATRTLDRIFGGLDKAVEGVNALQARFDKLGPAGLARRAEEEFKKFNEVGKLGLDKMAAQFDDLAAKTKPAWAKIITDADGALGDILKKGSAFNKDFTAEFDSAGTDAGKALSGSLKVASEDAFAPVMAAAGVLKTDLASGFGDAGTEAAKALTAGLDAAAPTMFSPILAAARSAVAEVDAALAGIGSRIEASAAATRMPSIAGAAGTAWENSNASLGARTRAARGVHDAHASGLHFGSMGAHVGGAHVGLGGDGIIPAVAGGVILEGLVQGIEAGFDFNHWTSQYQASGISQPHIDEAIKAAWGNAALNPNLSAKQGLQMIFEANKMTGDVEESISLLPTLATTSMAMQSVKAEDLHSHFNEGHQIFNFSKYLEEVNATANVDDKTPEARLARTQSYAREAMRTMIFSHGVTDGNSLYAMSNNSKGTAANWDERMATVYAPLIGDVMRHSKLGNADFMALKSYQGGHITSDAVEGLIKYGLVTTGEGGDAYEDSKKQWHLRANSKFAEGMERNLVDWSQRQLEKLKANGYDIDNQTVMNGLVNAIGSNGSTANLMRAVLEPGPRNLLQKEIIGRDRVPDDAAEILQKNDPVLKLDALHKKWDDLLTALGSPLVDPAIEALTKITSAINAFAQVMHDHPDATKLGGEAAGIAGAGLLGYGGGKMLGFWGGGDAGLGAAATQLDASALALKEAAAVLAGHGGMPAMPGTGKSGSPGGPSGKPGGTSFSNGRGLWATLGLLGIVANSPGMDEAGNRERDANAAALEGFGKALGFDYLQGLGDKLKAWAGSHPGNALPLPPDRYEYTAPNHDGNALHEHDNDLSPLYHEGLKKVSEAVDAAGLKFGSLNDRTGFVLTSFDNLDKGILLTGGKFDGLTGDVGSATHELSVFALAVRTVTTALAGLLQSAGGGMGGGSGFMNASFGGGGVGGGGGGSWNGNALAVGGGFGSGSWSQSGATRPEVADYIKRKAAELGIDPNVALRVSQSEGFNTYTGDYGTSFGPFQLHYGGSGIRGMNSGGLGDAFTHATGLDARDPKTWKAQVDFALRNAKRDGWGAWHGAAHVGIGNRQGLDWHSAKPAPTAGPPPKKSTPGSPASDKPMVSAQNDATHNHHIYLDGRKIAQVVTKHQAAAMRFPTDMGGPDAHGSFVSPGTPVTDAA